MKKDDDLDEEGGYAALHLLALPQYCVCVRAQICARRTLHMVRSAQERRRARGH
jgi:hypothetical protein